MDDIELDRKLRAFLRAEYARLERGQNLNPDPPPDSDAACARADLVNEFARLCRRQPNLVKEWLADYERMNNKPEAQFVRPSFPVIYWEFLERLSEHKDIDWCDTARVRELLDGGRLSLAMMLKRQRELGKRKRPNRRPDALQCEILEILKRRPRLDWREVLTRLETNAGVGAVLSIKNGYVEWQDYYGKIKPTEYAHIEDRVYRAKKRLAYKTK